MEKKQFFKKCKSRYQKHKQKSSDLNFKTNTNIYTKIDLTLKYEPIKFLGEITKSTCDLVLGKEFLDMTHEL